MNLQMFKQKISDCDNCKEKFRLFRIWAENYYVDFKKNKELSYKEEEMNSPHSDKFMDTPEYEYFVHKWSHVDYSGAISVFCKMGKEIGEDIKNIQIKYDCDVDTFYHGVEFESLFEKVKKEENDIEFCYGLLALLSIISEKSMIYKYYILNIQRGLKEYGLEKCQEMIGNNIKKVFVAMCFKDKMKPARLRIEKAVSECGYEPIFIDVKEYNGQIVPEIFKEIDDSEFIIADLTGQRGGVYYEAGYAMAKEKQVILCCKNGKKKTHFDVAQINTIYWEDEDDLHDRLVARIKATIGENL